jgi:transcription antitermination factor NusG
MLDTTANTPALLPQQVAAHASDSRATTRGSRLPWCVVTSQPRAERAAHAELHRRGFEAYLPLCTWRRPNRHWSTGPLFPRYLFVRMDPNTSWNPVLYAPGVYSLLLSGEKPGTVAEADISALRAGDALRASPTPPSALWAPGMACRLGKGHTLEGVDAVVSEVGPTKALVATMMFGHLRDIAVNLDCLAPRADT